MADQSEKQKKPELLAPAGDLETLKTAIRYGADAVYIGGEAYSLRSAAKNASKEDLAEGVRFAHERGKRVYVTANILAHNDDLREAETFFRELRDVSPDAVIVSDPGMFLTLKRVCPGIAIHISTQANNVNYETARFWHELGASRIVVGRELSLSEIREFREHLPDGPEIEAFVHGSMCISYSGRCLLSNYMTGRDANRGSCAHPCRYEYALVERTRPGEYFPVEETERGSFILNSKDLSMIAHLDDLVSAGIDSFKIEGRMKTPLYVASTVRAYRTAIDDYFTSPELYRNRIPEYEKEASLATVRPFSTGFFYGKPDAAGSDFQSAAYKTNAVFLGIAGPTSDGRTHLTQKNKFVVGEEVTVMKRHGDRRVKVLAIENERGERMESAPHAKEELFVTFSEAPDSGDVLRIERERI